MDQRTRKLMTMHKVLHPRDDVDRLYVSRKEGGRGLASVEDTVDASIQRLEDYTEKHERGLITIIRNDTDNTINERMTTTRKQKWEGKQPYGRFKRLINNISHQKTWTWLRKGNFKRETESLLIAAQDDAIRTNNIKARIDKTQQNSKCRLCGDRDETINHIISECSKLAQGVQGETRLGRQGDPLGNVQKISIRPYQQMVYAQPGTCPWKWFA